MVLVSMYEIGVNCSVPHVLLFEKAQSPQKLGAMGSFGYSFEPVPLDSFMYNSPDKEDNHIT